MRRSAGPRSIGAVTRVPVLMVTNPFTPPLRYPDPPGRDPLQPPGVADRGLQR
jgi:hypothetical protein